MEIISIQKMQNENEGFKNGMWVLDPPSVLTSHCLSFCLLICLQDSIVKCVRSSSILVERILFIVDAHSDEQ